MRGVKIVRVRYADPVPVSNSLRPIGGVVWWVDTVLLAMDYIYSFEVACRRALAG